QNSRYIALRLLDKTLPPALRDAFSADLEADRFLAEEMDAAWRNLDAGGITPELLADDIVTGLVRTAEEIAGTVVHSRKKDTSLRDRRLDRLFASRLTGIPIMLFMLALILWITLSGANYPSDLLSRLLFRLQDGISQWFLAIGAPEWLRGILVSGAFRVLCWVVSVMLPPMAIFFPLFTLLEQFGYLPRVAFNLDHAFQKAKTCGKQALTMCMGFGCNAVGVTGCRIIDSPRERLIAMLTNNFVPCNGRFPTLIAIITMFCVGTAGAIQQIYAVLLLTAVLVFGILMTFLVSRALSATLLKGIPSSFTLELPPYRRPRIGQVLVRSVLDRTLFVLGRAAVIAAPAGAVIWLLANTSVGDLSLLSQCTHFLDPFAKLLGLDGVILTAFILGFPANEIVIPIIIMSYLSTGSLQDPGSLEALRTLFVNNGWTLTTAVCTMLFSLMHWPCSTTCFTIWKESRSVKWTLISIALPTILGMFFCFLVASGGRLIQSFF
ncbi:MAG: nucleoside recognition domain-containing protein, partial [Oscillospiraceae bacterium]|nr:nucleoside recognition domain-containing protein [Oscillospiraceae bacterium]